MRCVGEVTRKGAEVLLSVVKRYIEDIAFEAAPPLRIFSFLSFQEVSIVA